jgi:hypothetical protein
VPCATDENRTGVPIATAIFCRIAEIAYAMISISSRPNSPP